MSEAVMFVCPPPPREMLPLEARLAVGFGWVAVEVDGEVVWHGDNWQKKLRSVERLARRQPDRRWTVEFYGPMQGTIYERQARDTWVLIDRNEGFA